MGNIFFEYFNNEENLSIFISLPKTCYYPGELLSGKIILQAKNNKLSTIFNFPNSHISITQYQQYQYFFDNILITKTDKKQILSKSYNFKKYINCQIIKPLSLPFNLKIPLDIDPTLLYGPTTFTRHFLTVKFSGVNHKKTIGIIIQNRKKIFKEDNLFTPLLEQYIHKSIFFKQYSKIKIQLNTDKISYAYNEIIPYEIIINYYDNHLAINHLRVSLTRNIYFGANDKVDSEIIYITNI